jgi:prepilin-type N-terminal cleavage/methylation domain-containing protein
MRARVRVRPRGDAGMTLLELMITVSIMAVVLLMFTGAMIQIYRSVNKNEAIATARDEINHVFTRLDKEIRYAAGISLPSTGAGDRYVEFLITNTGDPTCVQLRVHVSSAQLQRRSWLQSGGTPGSWTSLASGITATNPFTRYPATGDFAFQRLRIDMTTKHSSGATATKRQTDITFTALNTSPKTSSDNVCTEGRQVP